MAIGIQYANNITYENVTALVNISRPEEFFVNVSYLVYAGWLYFILLVLAVFVLYVLGQRARDQPIQNLFISFGIATILSLLLRAVYALVFGIEQALISDNQLWFFPIVTALLAWYLWSSDKNN